LSCGGSSDKPPWRTKKFAANYNSRKVSIRLIMEVGCIAVGVFVTGVLPFEGSIARLWGLSIDYARVIILALIIVPR
jgi:hypothetical protein